MRGNQKVQTTHLVWVTSIVTLTLSLFLCPVAWQWYGDGDVDNNGSVVDGDNISQDCFQD